jgi:hypothetical protein
VKKSWSVALVLAALVGVGGCDGNGRTRNPGRGGGGGNNDPMPDLLPPDPLADYDHDGYSIAAGDCNDWSPLVNPSAVDVLGNGVDDDCDGVSDQAPVDCDQGLVGKLDGMSLAAAMGQCNTKHVDNATFKGPSDPKARAIVPAFGVIKPMEGSSMVLLSTGKATDKKMSGHVTPQIGTDLSQSNVYTNPEPTLVAKPGCGMGQPPMVNDYTEFVLTMKAPSNAYSFSFNFQFFSAEYPEFVCTMFNDMFIVQMESKNEFQNPTNICFDEGMNPVTVNNGFFTVCQNSSSAQTKNCKKPVSEIAGTGYEDSNGSEPIGGSTGWLTTTAPVTPGEEVTLHFMIFDEGDHIYDSAVLIDNFKWSVNAVEGPTTIQ